MNRRDLLMAGLCAASAGAGYYYTPRKVVSLVGNAQLNDLVPMSFGDWLSRDVSDPLALNDTESLSAQLYNQMVTRLYSNTSTGAEIVMLLAYGAKQTDSLQLHRPEVCYPAFGYELTRNEAATVPIVPGVTVPARRLVAEAEGRRESVLYWSRIGETLPLDGSQQRSDRLRMSLQGLIPDGLLARFTSSGVEPDAAWTSIEGFVAELIVAMKADRRKVLIGTARAEAMLGPTA
jgi:EpsI family protein